MLVISWQKQSKPIEFLYFNLLQNNFMKLVSTLL